MEGTDRRADSGRGGLDIALAESVMSDRDESATARSPLVACRRSVAASGRSPPEESGVSVGECGGTGA